MYFGGGTYSENWLSDGGKDETKDGHTEVHIDVVPT